jgi:short-subunit dehydrogenase
MMDKSILITGCSSGIGLHAATQLKQRGYQVFATARKPADVIRLTSLGFESLVLDVNDSNSIKQALNDVLKRTNGTLYAVFNNAGYLQAGAVEDVTRDMMRAQFETNVFGAMELTRLVLPIMRKQGYGRIIQNSSILGIIPMSYCGVYNASKYALEGYSSSLRHELRHTCIYVSIIVPGPFESKLRHNAFQQFKQTLHQQTDSNYHPVYQKMEKTYFNPNGQDSHIRQKPDAIVNCLIHALESARPKAHYYAGLPAKVLVFLKRILPDTMLDWLICKVR